MGGGSGVLCLRASKNTIVAGTSFEPFDGVDVEYDGSIGYDIHTNQFTIPESGPFLVMFWANVYTSACPGDIGLFRLSSGQWEPILAKTFETRNTKRSFTRFMVVALRKDDIVAFGARSSNPCHLIGIHAGDRFALMRLST